MPGVVLRIGCGWVALVLAVFGSVACSPTFNWRELRPEGTPLEALMPCKPESASRPVPLLGSPVELHMHSCEAGGLTFAIAWAGLADATQASEALASWQAASLAAIRVDPGDAAASGAWAVKVTGATHAQGVKARGSDHQGQPLQATMVYFEKDRRIYQAAIFGARIDDAVGTAFFEGLVLP